MVLSPRRRIATAAAALFLAVGVTACGSSAATTSSPTTAAAASTKAAVTIKNFTFVPATITVKAGGTVTWTNHDSVQHSVESTTGAWKTSPLLSTNQSFSHTFPKSGTYPYICGVHNYMTGTVKVVS